MLSDREKKQEFCDILSHRWSEEYYGYKCENCGLFIPYGCEPWMPEDDIEGAEEWDDEPEYPF